MTVTFFSSCYPRYLDYFYAKHPALHSDTYARQMEAIMADHFSVWGSYTSYFKKLGVQAEFIIPNCKPLQKAWAKENGIKFDKDWAYKIPLYQIRKSRPDIFFTGSMFEYFGSFLDDVRSIVPNIFGWVACEIPHGVQLNKLDLIITSLPYYVDKFRNAGIQSEWINAAFDKEVLTKLGPTTRQDIDLSFIGSFTRAHANRIELVNEMIKHTPIKLFGTDFRMLTGKQNIFQKFFQPSEASRRVAGEAWGMDMFRVLQRSRITLNVHIDISKDYTGNIRMFEATGVGTLLLSDGKYAKNKLFNDDEVVYYDTVDEAVEKARYYLEHEVERNKIALKGQQKTLTHYNYEMNAAKMYEFFRSFIYKSGQKSNRNVFINQSH